MSRQPAVPGIDWSIAPKGATHRHVRPKGGLGLWYKFDFERDRAEYFSDIQGDWVWAGSAQEYADDMDQLAARPVEVEEVWAYDPGFIIQFPSLKALLADYVEVEHDVGANGDDTVYRGEWATPDPAKYVIGIQGVTEYMWEQAAGEIEDLDDYPQISDEGAAELKALLEAWARKHAKPDFRIVTNITKHLMSEVGP